MFENYLWSELYKAFEKCLKNKKNKKATLNFYDENLSVKLYELYDELLNKTYKPNPSFRYIISDPAWREIYAADFKDRIVHHLFMNHVETLLENTLIDNCCSCRKGKGTSYALKQLKEGLIKLSNNYQNEVYYIKLDISGYFASINRERLNDLFIKLVNEKYQVKNENDIKFKELLLYLCKYMFLTNPADERIEMFNKKLLRYVPERRIISQNSIYGMAIGNLPAQAGSNLNLSYFDRVASDYFQVYIRYVDDIIICDLNIQKLKNNFNKLIKLLSIYHSIVNLKKSKIANAKYGIKFLGRVTYPTGVQKPTKEVCIRTMNSESNSKESIASRVGCLKKYNCTKLIENYLTVVNCPRLA